MCGISGFINTNGEPASLAIIERMTAALDHRGPDARGFLTQGSIALGHTRLSIIDLATGDQPMRSDDGALSLVFNGEIFNYRELRQELLEAGGRPFGTTSDTEVVLRLYEIYGPDMVKKLNGQWAIALWDKLAQRLFLSRDRIGVRPLHYARFAASFVFASEVKSLFCHPAATRAFNPRGLGDILSFWAPLPGETAFLGVKELTPGHSLIVDSVGRECLRQDWQWTYPDDRQTDRDPDLCAEELLERLTDAVRLRLRADVPVGAYLSGGLDSSLITSIIASLRQKDYSAPLATFSLSFTDEAYDESSYQTILAKALRTEHHVIRCQAQDIGNVFEDVVWHAERPLLRTAPAPMFLLSRLVRQKGFKVVLTGEGADEVFAGYDVFREAAARRFLVRHPNSKWSQHLLRSLYPYMPEVGSQPGTMINSFFAHGAEQLDDPFYALRPRMRMTRGLHSLLSDDFRSHVAADDGELKYLQHLPTNFSHWHYLDQAQYLEATILLPGYILSSQGDRMSMANAVEGRFPFLDYRVVDFAAKLPPYMRLFGLKEKWLLKKAAARYVPSAILSRPKQPYRSPDIPSLMSGTRTNGQPLLDLLTTPNLVKSGVFRPDAVSLLVKRLKSVRPPYRVRDAMALSFVLSVQILHERFIAA